MWLTLVVAIPLPVLAWGFEDPFYARPDILQVAPAEHPELDQFWKNSRRGHIEAIAQILELYPAAQIYFLARDAELLYDTARLATRDEPTNRIHLLPVSRGNDHAEQLKEYLEQEGISESALRAGGTVLLVDTGFSGSISQRILEQFERGYQAQLKSQLMVSVNSRIPSTRVFLSALDARASSWVPFAMEPHIKRYESIPHFSDRASGFRRDANGRWRPVVRMRRQSPQINPALAQAYMQDLAAYLNRPEARRLLRERRAFYGEIYRLAGHGQTSALADRLRAWMRGDLRDPFRESLVRDVVEVHQKNLKWRAPLTLSEVGLEESRPARHYELPPACVESIEDMFSDM